MVGFVADFMFLYANGNLPYVEVDMIRILFDKIGKDTPIYFSPITILTSPPVIVWTNLKKYGRTIKSCCRSI